MKTYEIERKFLVKKLPRNLEQYKSKEIEQAYISRKPTIRIRNQDDEYFLTVKGKGDFKKIEYELNLTEKEYKNLFNKIEGDVVKKTRYYIPIDNGLTAELDVYYKNLTGLHTVEVEFNDIDICTNFQPPLWFGEDVSLDKRYKNTNLSINGLTDLEKI